jgi:hypothetical protein
MTLGPWIIVLYVPLHFLAFYIRVTDFKRFWGRLFAVALVITCVLSTISVGERTLMMLPVVIVVVFGMKMKPSRLVVLAILLIGAAGLLLPSFKWQYSTLTQASSSDLAAATFANDVSRAPVLALAIEDATLATSKVMPYPMAGYVYSSLFFVPRSIAPYKGVSTAQYFTADVIGGSPEGTQWGLGIGMIEEVLLNGGFVLAPLLVVVYGALLTYLQKLEVNYPALVVPNRLAGLFLFATQLPAILLMFATMAGAVLFLEVVFCGPSARVNLRDLRLEASGPVLRPKLG